MESGIWTPGVPETADYILSLVKEIVNGYDIDGIHFDYIRYPEEAEKNSRIKRCIINPVRKSLWQTGVGRISTGWFIVFTIG